MRYALLLLLALPLTACGGVSLNAVAKAADNASAKGSEHVALQATVTAAGQTVKMTGGGDFQTHPQLGQLHLSLVAAGKQIEMDEVMSGTTIYMKSPLFTPSLPSGKSWVSVDLEQAGKKLGIDFDKFAQQNPTDLLGALKKAGSVKKVGSDVVGGVDTTHYKVTIDLAKAPNGAQLMKIANVKALPVDVWVDDQDLLRRMTETYSVTTGGQTVATTMQMDLSSYGEHVNVQVPSADETVDVTKLGGTG